MSTPEDTECAHDVKVCNVITERLYYCFLVFDNKLIEKKNVIFVFFMVVNFNLPRRHAVNRTHVASAKQFKT